jgi:hypothetical protein
VRRLAGRFGVAVLTVAAVVLGMVGLLLSVVLLAVVYGTATLVVAGTRAVTGRRTADLGDVLRWGKGGAR